MKKAISLAALPEKSRSVLSALCYGLSAGGAAVLFQYGTQWVFSLTLMRLATQQKPLVFLIGSAIVVMGTSAVVGLLLNHFCPEAAGSGIPQVKLAYWKDFGAMPLKAACIKFIAGIVSLGGGTSLGREGPTVHLCGALTSSLAGRLGVPKQERREALVSGAAAGLAAAFNAPLAAIAFVLEEIIEDLRSRYLGAVILAAMLGALVVHATMGKQPAFILPSVTEASWRALGLSFFVGVVAAMVGVVFQKWSLKIRNRSRQSSRVPNWCKPMIGGGVTWGIGVAVYLLTGHIGIFGLGYLDLSNALANGIVFKMAALLLLGKLIATCYSYGWGGCGGIFSPTLFLGGMCGAVVAGMVNPLLSLTPNDRVILMVVGMSACLGAVVQAPITSILIIFEMTHEFNLIPPLLIGALMSQAVARLACRKNFYSALLLQDGHELEKVIPPRSLSDWRSLSVAAISNYQPVVLHELSTEECRKTLVTAPFKCFPVLKEGGLIGFVDRQTMETALQQGRKPDILPLCTCAEHHTIHQAEKALIESHAGVIGVLDRKNGQLVAILTLHDLLRAAQRFSDTSDA